MKKGKKKKQSHILFEPIESPWHLARMAKKEKREVFQIFAFIILLFVVVFSFQRTIYVVQTAEESRKKIRAIEEKFFQYTSEYDMKGHGLKEGEEIKFGGNGPKEILKCREFFENACSICGKTEGEITLAEKADREYKIRVEREKARARQAAALARKRAAAPLPVSAKKVNGKLFCAKKNDKPRKSKVNNRGKMHWDRECCLDPDEWPNPWCAY